MIAKRILPFFLACILIFSLFSLEAFAASASFSVSSAGSVTVGNRINVSVKVSGSEKIGSWNFALKYDPAMLEYVSGADSGGGGSLLFADSSDGTSSISKTVVFRARKIGSTTVSISGGQIISFDSVAPMSTNSASRKINIVAAPTLSGENNLSALSVSQGTFTPEFDPATTEYAMTVPFEINSLVFTGTAKHNAASVAVSASDALVVGANPITITVTAQNGRTKTYTVTVTREESLLAGVTTKIDEVEYSVAYDPALLQIPSGFTASTAKLGERDILTYSAPQNTIAIAYLVAGESGAWYVFDEKEQSFSPFVMVNAGAPSLVILSPGKDIKVPKGYLPEEVSFGEQKISAYSSEDSEMDGVYLVYAMAPDGTSGFYYYDSKLSSFAAYPAASISASAEESEAFAEMKAELEKAKEKADLMEIIVLSVSLGAVILFVILLVVAFKKGKAQKVTNQDKNEKREEKIDEIDLLLMNESKTQVIPNPESQPEEAEKSEEEMEAIEEESEDEFEDFEEASEDEFEESEEETEE